LEREIASTTDNRALARLVIDLLIDALPGTPSRVVSVLADAGFDTAEAGRRLGKGQQYVRTNLARFIKQARERCANAPIFRLLVADVIPE
jgi:hypothetical protein